MRPGRTTSTGVSTSAWAQRRHRGTQLSWLARLATLGLAGLAVTQELRKPADRRRWHGIVAGYVPYDFRWPSRARYRSRLWAPEASLIQPQTFGVGWTLNLGRLLHRLHLR